MFDDLLPAAITDPDYDDLLDAISIRVGQLMDQDVSLLFSYMYRLDIDEHKLKHAVQNYSGDSRIHALAELILKRQLLRIALRKKYSSNHDQNLDL